MEINYWNCLYSDFYEVNVGTDKQPDYLAVYGCLHEDGGVVCDKDNKWADDVDECDLAEIKEKLDVL